MPDKRLYFAYGSNINLGQMAYRCPDAIPIKPVELHGYALTYRGGGVATVIPKEGDIVYGLLWEITPQCEKSLDHYEGYPHLYHKADVTVTDPQTGEKFTTMMYEMDERYKAPAVPPKHYFDGIAEGYIQNDMDVRPLMRSLRKVKEEYREYQKNIWDWDFPEEWKQSAVSAKKKQKKDHER